MCVCVWFKCVCVCVCVFVCVCEMHAHACALHLCIALLCVHLFAWDCSQQALLQNVKNPWAPRWRKKTAQAVMVQEEYQAKTCPAMDFEKKQTCLGQVATDMHVGPWVFKQSSAEEHA